MILPRNGRVIIIDDEIDQAFPLISALSKYTVACNYFDGKIEKMPESCIDDARVVFLDINLNGASQPNWNTEKGLIIGAIKNIISPNTPYILFIWSVKSSDQAEGEKTHFEEVAELFENELLDYKPIIPPLEMGKNEIFEQKIIERDGLDDEIKWTLRYPAKETIEVIKNRIEEGISQIDAVEALLKWENIVSNASSNTFKEILSLASENGGLNNELKSIYFKLAEAMWGRQLKDKNFHQITDRAVSMFNHLLADKIETDILGGLDYKILKEYGEPQNFGSINIAKLNSKILLSFDSKNEILPGAIINYDQEVQNYPFKSLIADLLDIPKSVQSFYIQKNHSEIPSNFNISEYKNKEKKEYSAFEKEIRDKIKESSIFINVELSPICDYVQKKWKANRLCPGLLWREEFFDYIGSADSLYISPSIYYNEQIYKIVIDLRYFTSLPLTELLGKNPMFSLRHSILVDIQANMSKHINRPGVSALL